MEKRTHHSSQPVTSHRKTVPGPHGYDFLRALSALRQRPLQEAETLMHHYGEVVRLPLPWRRVYLVTHPEGIKEVLQRKPHAYSKQVHPYTLLQRLFGQGLFTSEGRFWLSHRRLMQPAFHRNRL